MILCLKWTRDCDFLLDIQRLYCIIQLGGSKWQEPLGKAVTAGVQADEYRELKLRVFAWQRLRSARIFLYPFSPMPLQAINVIIYFIPAFLERIEQ